MKWHGEAASVSVQVVETEQERLQEIIAEGGYERCDLFNADETSLFYV